MVYTGNKHIEGGVWTMPKKVDDVTAGTEKLLEALASDSGIKRIIEIGYKILGNPISLVDTSRKTIVLTNSPEVEDDLTWQELAKDGYFSSYTIKHNYSVGLTNKLSNSSKPFIWASDEYIKYNRLLARILYKNKTIGILAVMESKRPFKPSDLELASVLCNAISVEMQKNIFLRSTMGYGYEEFLKDLLDGKMRDRKIVQSRRVNLNLDLKKYIFVLVIDITNMDKSNIFPLYLRKTIEQLIANSNTIEYNGNIVLLVSSSNKKSFLEFGLTELDDYMKQNGLACGISNYFHDLADLKEYYSQAIASLKLGRHFKSNESIFKYKDFIVYHFIDVCSQHIEIDKIIHPALLNLMEYDEQNNTEYLNTLYTFFECSRSIPLTAKRMNIHRNSMFYRMKKIDDIIETDFTDNSEMLLIELSFKLLEYGKSEFIRPRA